MKFNFQFVIMVIFILAAVFGVLVFSGAIPIGGGGAGSQGTVVLWGTIPTAAIADALQDFNNTNKTFTLNYEEKSAATFDQDLLEALASGVGPDIFLLPDNLTYHYANKIFVIPYESYPAASFKNVFAGAGEVFLTAGGILAFPISIDPLMLYYNRAILDGEGITSPPATWEDFSEQVNLLTKVDDGGRITRSGAALGQYENVLYAKDILATLFLQAGNPIVREEEGVLRSTLNSALGNFALPSILQFYISFADPNNALYSWNRSFPDSQSAFSNEDLAFYFGYASELPSLMNRNPNQNFSVTSIPQIKDAKFKVTEARVTGIAVSAFSKNLNAALVAANLLTSSDFAAKLAVAQSVAPARRDLLNTRPLDSFSPLFYSSALFARSWLDPSPSDTDDIFKGMVNDVLSNNQTADDAIKDASSKLELLLIK